MRSTARWGGLAMVPLPSRGSPTLQGGGKNEQWPTSGWIGYLTPAVWRHRNASERKPDFSGVTGIQDHDPILIHASPWSQQVLPEMCCAMWNRRDVTSYKKRIAALTADMPPPVSAHDCALTYAQLTSHMLPPCVRSTHQRPPSPPCLMNQATGLL